MEFIININNASVGYGQLEVLKEISLSVKKGSLIALIGQNGAGKSTLLKTMASIVEVKQGTVTLGGRFSYMPQGIRVFSKLTVKENVLILTDKKEIPDYIYRVFPAIKRLLNNLAGDLSGGEQQMVALARSLIDNPEILFLDEPSLGLSPKLVKDVFKVIKKLNKELGITVVIVEHNLSSMMSILDEAYVLEKGRIVRTIRGEQLTDLESIYKSILGIS
jgi:branched-chain amino acid transport system ATP-binding protein